MPRRIARGSWLKKMACAGEPSTVKLIKVKMGKCLPLRVIQFRFCEFHFADRIDVVT